MPKEERFVFLNSFRLKVLLAFASRIIPEDKEGDKVYIGADNPETMAIIDYALSRQPRNTTLMLKIFLLFFEWSGILFTLKPFSKMPPEKRDRHIQFFESSRISKFRQAFWGLKTLVMLGYYTQDRVWKYLGYEGPKIQRAHPNPFLRNLQTKPFKADNKTK